MENHLVESRHHSVQKSEYRLALIAVKDRRLVQQNPLFRGERERLLISGKELGQGHTESVDDWFQGINFGDRVSFAEEIIYG